MLSNFQRAHDIALHSADMKISALISEAAKTGRHITYNYYELYKAAYNEALTQVEKDFPNLSN